MRGKEEEMIYFISGASRSGKSIVGNRFAKRHQLSILPIDSLMMSFMSAFPDIGIHHELWPHEIAEKLWPFLEAMVDFMIHNDMDYVFEGEALLPKDLHNLKKKYPGMIRGCFLGFKDMMLDAKVEAVVNNPSHENDWLVDKPNDYIRSHIQNMKTYSKTISDSCNTYGLPYIEMDQDFESMVTRIMDLLEKEAPLP